MNALEKYAAKKKQLSTITDNMTLKDLPKSMKIGLGLMGGGAGLALLDPGGVVSKAHKHYGKKYPVHVRGEK